jgi:hypothetical protein
MIAIVDAPDPSCETQIPISVLFAIGFRLGFWQSYSHGVFRHHFQVNNAIRPKDSVKTLLGVNSL